MSYIEFSAIVYFLSLALCFVLYIEYKKYRLDKLRFKLFRIRDELFYQASDGSISFDDEAYQIVRTNLNGMIRYSHDLSLLNLLLYKRVSKSESYKERTSEYRRRMARAMGPLNPGARKVIIDTMDAMHKAVLTHIALNSPLAILATCLSFMWFVFEKTFGKVKSPAENVDLESSQSFGVLARRIDALDTEVNELGCAA